MNKYVVTFGFNGDNGYEVVNSKPIPAEGDTEACNTLRDQFEMYEGIQCDIISVSKI
jgi:hypothetical protein